VSQVRPGGGEKFTFLNRINLDPPDTPRQMDQIKHGSLPLHTKVFFPVPIYRELAR
jgi:hypothetical protein